MRIGCKFVITLCAWKLCSLRNSKLMLFHVRDKIIFVNSLKCTGMTFKMFLWKI